MGDPPVPGAVKSVAPFRGHVHPVVFGVSGATVIAFVIVGAIFGQRAKVAFDRALTFIATDFGWFYTLSVGALVGFNLWLLGSRHANLKLGRDDDVPEFSTITWFAMLFSAGMGIGLLFYGVAEPIMHYMNPPRGPGHTHEAAGLAMSITFFHWGIHAWAIYAVMGLALAYFSFRKGLPLTVRSVLYPLLGDRIHGWPGNLVDILAVFGTLFGLATSLGLGAMQINAGLGYLVKSIPGNSITVQLILIAVITSMATLSVVSGLKRGVRRLSELNGILAIVLMVGVFLLGPTLFLLDSLSDNVGRYLKDVVRLTFWTHSLGDTTWRNSWTIFYWGWWIAWAPFVGMFIARISKGRTVREFVAGCLLAPTAVTFVWLTLFGNSALYYELFGGGGISQAVDRNVATALFELLARLPGAGPLSALAVVVVALFFVTSSDSGSLVVDMLTSGGNPDPPVWQRIFWALSEGAVAAVLLLTGGLIALRSAAICTGLPFCVVLLLTCVSLVRAFRAEARQPVPSVAE